MIPDARLSYIVRQPIERFRSGYLDELYRGRQRNPIETVLATNPGYLAASWYAMQIGQYLEQFRRQQLLVIVSEDLKRSRAATMALVHAFLGVEDIPPPTLEEEFNRTRASTCRARWRGPSDGCQVTGPSPAFEERLRDLLRNDVRRLRAYRGDGFDG